MHDLQDGKGKGARLATSGFGSRHHIASSQDERHGLLLHRRGQPARQEIFERLPEVMLAKQAPQCRSMSLCCSAARRLNQKWQVIKRLQHFRGDDKPAPNKSSTSEIFIASQRLLTMSHLQRALFWVAQGQLCLPYIVVSEQYPDTPMRWKIQIEIGT